MVMAKNDRMKFQPTPSQTGSASGSHKDTTHKDTTHKDTTHKDTTHKAAALAHGGGHTPRAPSPAKAGSAAAVSASHSERKSEMPAASKAEKPSATSAGHPDKTDDYRSLVAAFETLGDDFSQGLLEQLIAANSRSDKEYDAAALLFGLSVINGENSKEASRIMLKAQMALTHQLTLKHATQLARADDPAIQDLAERAYNKLARTFVIQMEALNRTDLAGEQKVTVEQHVSVNEGGQAIVAHLSQEGPQKQAAEKTPALTDARQVPMEIIRDPEHVAVPLKPKAKT